MRKFRLLLLGMFALLFAGLLGLAPVDSPAGKIGLEPSPAEALDNGVAKTPPMGWNSWNTFRCNGVNEQLIRDTADSMVKSGMKAAGYEYVVVDDCWMNPERDEDGNLQANPETFPSGMKALGDYIHSKGLKFGIYEVPGEKTCAQIGGGFPGETGSKGHEQQDANQFAAWGVDYLKYDWCSREGNLQEQQERFALMRDALKNTDRPIVYSINPNSYHSNTGSQYDWGDIANLWRTTDDIRPTWDTGREEPVGVINAIDLNAPLWPWAQPGAWNDPDMMVVGVQRGGTGLTDTEARSHFSMWSIMASPLMAGADLRNMSESTKEIMTNQDVIAVDQDPKGVQGRRIRDDGDQEVWVKPLANGDRAVVLFNRGLSRVKMTTSAQEVGMGKAASYVLRDLWSKTETATAGKISASVPSHGVAMYRVSRGTPDQAPPATYLSVDAKGGYFAAGEAEEVTTTLTNNGRIAIEDVKLNIEAPSGWTVEASSPATYDNLPPRRSVQTTWKVTPPANAEPGSYELNAEASYTYGDDATPAGNESSKTVNVVPPPPTSDSYLSDLDWFSATNGYGPVERDMSNGERAAGDGNTITIGGETYEKGLGTNAPSEITYYLGGNCSRFTSDVGVDDEVGDRGSVTFQVFADGQKAYDSGVLTGSDPAKTVDVSIAGAKELKLVVTENGSPNYDHADWADARVACSGGE